MGEDGLDISSEPMVTRQGRGVFDDLDTRPGSVDKKPDLAANKHLLEAGVDAKVLEWLASGSNNHKPDGVLGCGQITCVFGVSEYVAAKSLNPYSLSYPKEQVDRMNRIVKHEYMVLRYLNNRRHPSIVEALQLTPEELRSGKEAEVMWMKRVKGQGFDEIKASEDDVVEVTRQIASALDHAHSQFVLHRDIKAENIIWDSEKKRAVLIDWGIAIQKGEHGVEIHGLSKKNAPPEMRGLQADMDAGVFGGGDYDYPEWTEQTDQYMLAAMAWEKLGLGEIRYDKKDELVRPDMTPPGIPNGVYGIFAIALAKDPTKRYEKCVEFAEELNIVVKGE